MRRVLFELPAPSLLTGLLLLALVAVGVGIWLLWLRRTRCYSPENVYTGVAVVVMWAIILVVLNRLGEVPRPGHTPYTIPVNSYGTMLMLGFIGGTYSAIRLGKRRGIPAERILDIGLVVLVGAILGARLLYLLITPNAGAFLDIQKVLSEGMGGLSFHGGIIGGLLTGGLYIFFNRMSFWRVADATAPGIALGYAVTRIGCFLNGCCYGKIAPSWVSWAVNFPDSPDGALHHVHPTQLYATLMGLVMFGILLLLARGRSLHRAGRLFMVLLMLEGVERFVMEIFRQPDPHMLGAVTPAQFVSLLLIPLGIVGWFLLPNKPAVDEPAAVKVEAKAATK